MKFILVDQRHASTKTIGFNRWLKGLISVCLLGAPVTLGYIGYQLASFQNARLFTEETAQNWDPQIKLQIEELAELKEDSERQLEALTLRLAMLQAKLVRLDRVGQQITTIAKLDDDEFDFSRSVRVALVESTGIFTGPHVHFGIYKNGRVVDPATYIHRTTR